MPASTNKPWVLPFDSTLKSLSLPNVDFNLTPPKKKEFGDLSSNLPLLIGSKQKTNPLDIGRLISENLKEKKLNYIFDINVTAPGFLNFKIAPIFFQKQVDFILKKNEDFGKGSIGFGKSANVEFVSANPTGPLTVGHGRNAVLGDTISKIFEIVSPSTAFRPWPTVNGPVGLALTNSTFADLPKPIDPLPKSSFFFNMKSTCFWKKIGAILKFKNPGAVTLISKI